MASSSLSGRKLSGYDVGALVGAGGMGEVYRARDSKLNRDVAIKILLPAVASDTERLARFRREAQVLASLNHQNIAHIHGLEEADAGPFLVMEFVEGPTLADRIAQGPMPIDEALAIARQITDALEAAHERGVIHRDLKPANIKVDDHGAVKVLDFGLAKAIEQGSGIGDQGSGNVANSPTITTPAMTGIGMILGTAAYMSPEQAKGRTVDKRSDIWAFGCVLYEMLTGARAFGGEDVTDTIAAVVRGEPDWTKLPASTPSQVRLLLKRCLEKDRKARISDIGVARFLLNETIGPPAAAAASGSGRGPLVAIAALLIGALIGAAAWRQWSGTTLQPERQVQFELTNARVLPSGGGPAMLIARDGSFVVYRGLAASQTERSASGLLIRTLKDPEPRMLVAGPSRAPFLSPDGQWLGFFGGTQLRKVRVSGGTSVPLCQFDGEPRGASWGDDGQIVFAASRMPGLHRVSADGGEPQAVTAPEAGVNDSWPHVLPGSKAVLFTTLNEKAANARIDAVELATGRRKTLLGGANDARYMTSGHIVFSVTTSAPEARRQSRALKAARFDPARLEIIGEPETVVDPIASNADESMNYSVSDRDLVYVRGQDLVEQQRTLVWVDRSGNETAIPAPLRGYATARLSPDGARVVLDVRDQASDIWIWEFARQTLTPVTMQPALDQNPIWSADGRRVIWSSTRGGPTPTLYWQSADGSGEAQPLTGPGAPQFATSVTPDGGLVLFFGPGGGSSMDINAATTATPGSPIQPVLATNASEGGAEISPDGKWMVYLSTEAGENQVFVRPYPNVQDGRWQVSNNGGTRPVWSRTGRELFYLDRDSHLMSVPVQTASGVFSAGRPETVLKTSYYTGRTSLGLILRSYDVAADGKRFLMIKESANDQGDVVRPVVTVILNWAEELKSRLPIP